MFVPLRTPEITDIIADSAGAVLSHLGLWVVRSFQFKLNIALRE